jgi:hypothetical protein
VARPVDDDSRAEMERRREQCRRVVVDKQPYEREPPRAAGQDALTRLAQARTYAARHTDDGWWVRPENLEG